MKIKLKKIALCITSAGLLTIYGCGGGDSNNAAPINSHINFSGNSNGESVIDANNQYVKFLTASRSMEVFSGATTDITLDSSNNIIKGGNTLIGSVSLIAGSNNSTIAGLVSKSGTMLGVNTSSGGATLVTTNTPVPKPGTGSSGSSGSSGGLAACKLIAYPGDKSDVQTYAYDAIAQFDQCAFRATGNTDYNTDGVRQCKVLDGLIKATNSSFRPLFCPYQP